MEIRIPTLLRIKPGAIHKVGRYLHDSGFRVVALRWGEGIRGLVGERVIASLDAAGVRIAEEHESQGNDVEDVIPGMLAMPPRLDAIVAVGGGKVIDYCKYLAFLRQIPMVSVPTSVANDGMASPMASLMALGRRRSFKARIPYGVVIDTDVIARAPRRLSLSGIGDLISKYTAVRDWKLAYHAAGEPVNDFAVLVAMQSANSVANHPRKDLDDPAFLELVCGSLVMSGVAMEISGSSRPASGSEHLISHAYDALCPTPTLHGLQVGVAAYAVAWLQQSPYLPTMARALEKCGFFDYMRENPLSRPHFIEAIRQALTVKPGYYTVLSRPGEIERLVEHVQTDPLLIEMVR
jgi:glycerol-1-phosphate dehydrogenase [NAD(P)+]